MSKENLPTNIPEKTPENIPEKTDYNKERNDFNKTLLRSAPKTLTNKDLVKTLNFSQKIDSDTNMYVVLVEQLKKQGLSQDPAKDALAIVASVERELGPIFKKRFNANLKAGSVLEFRNGILGLNDEQKHWTGTDVAEMFGVTIEEAQLDTEANRNAVKEAANKAKLEDYYKRKEKVEEINSKVNYLIDTIQSENTGYVALVDPPLSLPDPDVSNIDEVMKQLEIVEKFVDSKCNAVYSKMYLKTIEYVEIRAKAFIAEVSAKANRNNNPLIVPRPGQSYESADLEIRNDMPKRFMAAINSLLNRSPQYKVSLKSFPETLSSKIKLEGKYSYLLQMKAMMGMAGQNGYEPKWEVLKGMFNKKEIAMLRGK